MSLSNKGKQQILRQQMHASFPFLIKITWGNGEVTRHCNADNDIEFQKDGESQSYTYSACVFSVARPSASESGYGTGTFKFSRLGDNSNVIRILRQTSERATIEIVGAIIYAEGQSEIIEDIYDVEYYLTKPTWGDDSDITFTLKLDDNLDLQMPCDTLDEITCAGIA